MSCVLESILLNFPGGTVYQHIANVQQHMLNVQQHKPVVQQHILSIMILITPQTLTLTFT